VVDDNRDTADSLATMLRLLGHDLHTAHDGLEAVQAAATFRPDMVLLDVGLPRLNGCEAAQNIRQQPWREGYEGRRRTSGGPPSRGSITT
jgi:CheY-like chemotaxis protein